MVPHMRLSTDCGLGCFRNKTKYYLLYTNSKFFSGLTTAQEVDPLPLGGYVINAKTAVFFQ
jgi:hypothetical protein